MSKYIADQTIKRLIQAGHSVKDSDVIVLGLTFKENCPDVRNSKVPDMVRELASFGCQVHVHDPLADPREAQDEHGLTLTDWSDLPTARAMVVAVAHRHYVTERADELLAKIRPGGLFIDVKSAFDPTVFLANDFEFWRL